MILSVVSVVMFLSHWLCYWLSNALFFFVSKKLGSWKAQHWISLILHLKTRVYGGTSFSFLTSGSISAGLMACLVAYTRSSSLSHLGPWSLCPYQVRGPHLSIRYHNWADTLDTQVHAALPPMLIRASSSEKKVSPLLVHWSLKTRKPKMSRWAIEYSEMRLLLCFWQKRLSLSLRGKNF